MSWDGLRSVVATLADTDIRSLLEPDEDKWPGCNRPRHGRNAKAVDNLHIGFLTFTIDELDRLCGRYGHEQEYARDVWRLRRLGIRSTAEGWRLDFRGIQQTWLRTSVKHFLRWRRDTEHSPSGIARDVIVLTQLSEALTDCAGAGAAPEQFDRAVIERFLTLLTERGYPPNARRQRMASLRRILEIARSMTGLPVFQLAPPSIRRTSPSQSNWRPKRYRLLSWRSWEVPRTLPN